MSGFSYFESYRLPDDVGGLVVDLGGVLVEEPALTELPGAAAWIHAAAKCFPERVVICSGQSRPDGHHSLISVLKVDGLISRLHWFLHTAKIRPNLFRPAIAATLLPPKEVVVIDDSPKAIMTALILGCRAIWVSEKPMEELSDEVEGPRIFDLRGDIANCPEQFVTIVPRVTSIVLPGQHL